MSDERLGPQTGESEEPSTDDAWSEVGEQLRTLGDSLATAFKAAWNDQENRQRTREMQTGLESMANQIGQAIKEGAASPEGQRLRGDAARVAASLRTAGEQTAREMAPHIASALRQVNAELDKAIRRMDEKESEGGRGATQ